MSDEEKGGSFVVKDRRRFDSDGNERTPDKAQAKGVDSPASNIKPKEVAQVSDNSIDSDSNDSEITFSSFVMSLATQALMQLGEIKPPPGVQIDVDKVAAKQTIDILSMLEKKTKGNLDSEESHLIEGILHNLRLSFVKVSK